MKRIPLKLSAMLLCALTLSCTTKAENRSADEADAIEAPEAPEDMPGKEQDNTAATPRNAAKVMEFTEYYKGTFDKRKSFIVISKMNETLSVYAKVDGDTVLVARYPVCLSLNKGNKQKVGDMKTPESTMEKPFTISQIQDASGWHHDFGDGRGSIKAYGNWFLRLATPGHSGIGIHGSTNNESSVPGRASEGCIRLRDKDIIHLKTNYAYKGMPVVIHAEDEPNYPFER